MARDDSSDAGWTGGGGGINGGGSNGSGNANSGNGWTTTTDPGGWTVNHYTGDDRDTSPEGNGGSTGSGALGTMATVVMGYPTTLGYVQGQWGFGLKSLPSLSQVLETTLAKLSQIAMPVAVSRIGSLVAHPVVVGAITAFYSPSLNKDEEVLSESAKYSIMTMAATQVTSTPMGSLTTMASIALDFSVVSAVISEPKNINYGVPADFISSSLQVVGLNKPMSSEKKDVAQVVQAQPTSQKNVYTAAIVPGKPAMQISVTNQLISSPPQVAVTGPTFVTPISQGEKAPTHHVIVTFPDNAGLDPVYVSVSPVLTAAERQALAEKARQEKAAWELAHPIEAAELGVAAAEMGVNGKQQALNLAKSTPFGLLVTDVENHPMVYTRANRRIVAGAFDYPMTPKTITISSYGNVAYFQLKSWESTHPLPLVNTSVEQQQRQFLLEDYNYLSAQINQAKANINNAQTELSSAQRELTITISKLGSEQTKQKIREAEQRKAEENKAIAALKSQVEGMLAAEHVLAYDGRIDTPQVSARGVGLSQLADDAFEMLGGISFLTNNPGYLNEELSGTLLSFTSPYADRLGIAIPMQYGLLEEVLTENDKPTTKISMRGEIISFSGETLLKVFTTNIQGISDRVQVYFAVKDPISGLYRVTLPETFGTILVTPINPPKTNIPPLGIPVSNIQLPLHTGTSARVVNLPTSTEYPGLEDVNFNDFILVFPAESGLVPIYVMLSSPPKSVVHHYKHYPPKGVPWPEIVKSTANKGKAKFKPGVNIPQIDMDVWLTGQKANSHPDWKLKKYDDIIGAYDGVETEWVVVKESQGTIHSHPISEQKAKGYLK